MHLSKRSGFTKRLVFVLHDMFAVLFDQVASIAGGSPAAKAVRKAARATVRAEVPDANVASQPKVNDAFVAAARRSPALILSRRVRFVRPVLVNGAGRIVAPLGQRFC